MLLWCHIFTATSNFLRLLLGHLRGILLWLHDPTIICIVSRFIPNLYGLVLFLVFFYHLPKFLRHGLARLFSASTWRFSDVHRNDLIYFSHDPSPLLWKIFSSVSKFSHNSTISLRLLVLESNYFKIFFFCHLRCSENSKSSIILFLGGGAGWYWLEGSATSTPRFFYMVNELTYLEVLGINQYPM